MSPDSSRRGFTLLDSLVALAVLALALPLMIEAMRSAVWRMSSVERREAHWRFANDLMTEAVATLDGSAGVKQGVAGEVAWTIEEVRADPDASGGARMRSPEDIILVRVTVGDRAGDRTGDAVTLETLALAGAQR